MKNYFINLLMLLAISFESYSMKRDRITNDVKTQQSKYKRLKLDQNHNEQEGAISEHVMAKYENKNFGFLDLPIELQHYIFCILLPAPSDSALSITEKLEDVIVFLSTCSALKESFENMLILHVKKNIHKYKSVKGYEQDLLALACKQKRYSVAAMLARLDFSLYSLCYMCNNCQNIHFSNFFFAWAITNGHSDIVHKCLAFINEYGISFDFPLTLKDEFGRYALHLAVHNSNEVCISMLLAWNSNANVVDKYGNAPLDFALERGHLGIIKLLMIYKADPNIKSKSPFKLTPFMKAVIGGNPEIVRCLIDNNANVNERTYYGLTPLLCAIIVSNGTNSHAGIIQILKDKGAQKEDFEWCDLQKVLYLAIYYNWLGSISLLLGKGPLIEDKAWMKGDSPLSYALSESRFKIARFLIDKGADIYEKKSGESLLLRAIAAQSVARCNFLLEYDIEHRLINEPNNKQQTPLMLSCYLNNLEISDILVKNGAKVKCRNNNGPSALECAIDNNVDISNGLSELTKQSELIRLLLNNGSSVNDITGRLTPLMVAVTMKKMFLHKAAIVDLLLGYGADLYQANSNGQIAWDIAVQAHDHEMINLLNQKMGIKQ